jgi:hypothetical protein
VTSNHSAHAAGLPRRPSRRSTSWTAFTSWPT